MTINLLQALENMGHEMAIEYCQWCGDLSRDSAEFLIGVFCK